MNYTFDIEKYDSFFNMLVSFAGNDNSTESYYRNMFKENIARIFSTIQDKELEDNDVYKLNKIIQDILDYRILIKDIYEIIGTMYYNIDNFIDIFYNFNTRSTIDMLRVYTTKVDILGGTGSSSSEYSSIADIILKNIKNMTLTDKNVYIKPNISYQYISDGTGFKNELEAFTAFYSNNVMRNVISGNNKSVYNFTNEELAALKEKFIASYDTGTFPIYLLGIQKTYNYELIFFKNLVLRDELLADTKLHDLYKQNSHLFNAREVMDALRLDLHKHFYREASDFRFRDIEFDPINYIHKLNPSNATDIKISTAAYNLILALINQTADKDTVVSYFRELKNFQQYIYEIYETAIEQFGDKIKIGG